MPLDDRPRAAQGPRARPLHYATDFLQPELIDHRGARHAMARQRAGQYRCEITAPGELSFFVRDASTSKEDRPPGGGCYRLEADLDEAWLESGAVLDVEPRQLLGALVDVHTHPCRRTGDGDFAFDPSGLLELRDLGVRAAVTMFRGPLDEQGTLFTALCRGRPWLVPLAWPRLGVDRAEDAERLLDAGFRGLKFHPHLDQRPADDPAMDPFLALARRYRVPVQVHSAVDEPSRPERVAALAARFPDVPVVMIHAGLGIHDRRVVLELARGRPNLYLETSWLSADGIVAAMEAVDSSRTLFGTDTSVDGPGQWARRTLGGPAGRGLRNVPELLAAVRARVPSAAFINWTRLTAVRLYRLRFASTSRAGEFRTPVPFAPLGELERQSRVAGEGALLESTRT
jgi:hypothetical protein